jgi:hypothetical protein
MRPPHLSRSGGCAASFDGWLRLRALIDLQLGDLELVD